MKKARNGKNHQVERIDLSGVVADEQKVTLKCSWPILDICLLEVEQENTHYFLLTTTTFPSQKIACVGFPSATDGERLFEKDPKAFHGRISAFESPYAIGDYLGFPNMSGSPVISELGEVVGIHVGTIVQEDYFFHFFH